MSASDMTPDKLRAVADWLDIYDRMAEAFFDLCAQLSVGPPDQLEAARRVSRGTEVQDDLRRWADEMAA